MHVTKMFNDYCAYTHVISIFILLSRFLVVNNIFMFVPLVFFTIECCVYFCPFRYNSNNTFCNTINSSLVHFLHIHMMDTLECIVNTPFITIYPECLSRSNSEYTNNTLNEN